MRELGLRYKGKRCPFRFKNPRFEGSLDFMSNKTVVWVKKANADWLISNNPRMFEVMGDRGKAKNIEPIAKVEEVNIDIEDSLPVITDSVDNTDSLGKKEVVFDWNMKKVDVIENLTKLQIPFDHDARRWELLRHLKTALEKTN